MDGGKAQIGKKGNEKTNTEEIIPLTVQKRKTVRISFSEEETPLGSPRELGSRPVLFEEAIARTGHGKFHYLLLFTCGLGLISMIVETVCVSYLMPAAECDFQMTSHDKGILSAICYFGMVASSHLWGYLADTRGRRKVLIATLLLDFLCAIVGSFAHTFWLFVVFRFLNGFFICGPSAVVYVYLGEFHTAEHRTKAIMWACIFISIGIISLPGLAWLVIPLKWNFDTPWFPYSSWRLFVALCGVPSLVTCIIMALFLPESPKFYQAIGQDEEALKALRYIYTVNKGNSPDKYPVKAIMSDPSQEDVDGEVGTSRSSGVFTGIWKQTAPLFQTPHLRNTVIACLIQLGLYASFNSLLLWLPDLFNRLAVYSSSHPNQTATVCEILSILKKEGDDSLLSPENLTSHATVLTNKSSQLNSNVTSSCVVNIDPIVFQNTLVIGFTSAMAYLLVSQVVNHVNKNKIVAFALAASGLTILGMYFVHTTAEVLPLSCIYVALPGMCVSVLSGIVIDIFPTHLRAMAVCLSLMMGRLGTGASSLMLGALLEFNCALVIFILVGVVIGCGMLALLLPSPEKKVTSL